jgi:LPS sulfotransferase NodH
MTRVPRPDRAYVVCSTQRSGSTYLCSLLASTGVAGNPQEFFEAMAETGVPPQPRFFLAGLPLAGVGPGDQPSPGEPPEDSGSTPYEPPEYSDLRLVKGWRAHLERSFRLGTTANGVFAVKLMWNQLPEMQWHAAALPELAGLEGRELLEALFGPAAYVWIRRRDTVRQSISLWRALQSGAWRRERGADGAAPAELLYSFDAIEHLRRRLAADDAAWGRFFVGAPTAPLELHYEDDVGPDPADAVARVLAHLDLELPPDWTPSTSMVRQSDEINDAWRAAYDRDAAARV